jgi:spermidine synthase
VGRRGRHPTAHRQARFSPERVECETDLAWAQVIPEDGRPWRRLLRLDDEDCSHVDLRDPTRLDFAYVRRLGDVVDVVAPPNAPIDALHLGGGGFTLPRYVAATRPGSRQVVAEVDAALVALAREHLGLRPSPVLRVRHADARAVLARHRAASADLVVLDAYVGTEIPAHLATLEFAELARRALRPGGVFAANVIDAPPMAVTRALAATLRAVFPHVALVAARKLVRGRQGGNAVLLAAGRPLPVESLRTRALRGGAPELVVSGPELDAFAGGAAPSRDPAPVPGAEGFDRGAQP